MDTYPLTAQAMAADVMLDRTRETRELVRRAVYTTDPGARVDRQRLAGYIRHFFMSLPPRQREVFDLVDLQGHDPIETRRQAGDSPPSVMTETIQLSCITTEQASELATPYLRSSPSAVYTSDGLRKITLRGRIDEFVAARREIRKAEREGPCSLPAPVGAPVPTGKSGTD